MILSEYEAVCVALLLSGEKGHAVAAELVGEDAAATEHGAA